MNNPSVRPKTLIRSQPITTNAIADDDLRSNTSMEVQNSAPQTPMPPTLEPTDINFTELNNLPRKDQRDYVGETIFPYIKRKVGQIAPKIAGMILSLPQRELIPGAKNTHTLDRMISEAQECLELNPHPPKAPSTTTAKSGDPSNSNVQHCNDYTSAMFQEISNSTHQPNQLSRYEQLKLSNQKFNASHPQVQPQVLQPAYP